MSFMQWFFALLGAATLTVLAWFLNFNGYQIINLGLAAVSYAAVFAWFLSSGRTRGGLCRTAPGTIASWETILIWQSGIFMILASFPFGAYLNWRESLSLTLISLICMTVIALIGGGSWYRKVFYHYAWIGLIVVLVSLCFPGITQKVSGMASTRFAKTLQHGTAYTINGETNLYVMGANGEFSRLKSRYDKTVVVFSLGETIEKNGAVYEKVGAPDENGQPGAFQLYIFSDDLKSRKVVEAKASVSAQKITQTEPAVAPTSVREIHTVEVRYLPAPPAEKSAEVAQTTETTDPEIWNARFRKGRQLVELDFTTTRANNNITMVADNGTKLIINSDTGDCTTFVHGKYSGTCGIALSGWEGSGWWKDDKKTKLELRRIS